MKHNPENPLWPGWKVTLLSVVLSFAVIMAIAAVMGGFGDGDPERAGEKAGYQYGWIIFAVPLVTYIVQKFRIDNWNRANPPREPLNDSRSV
jgi:hypothetical protein